MSNRCQLTGKSPGFGNNVSHSHRRTRRRFDANVHRHTFWVPSLGRRVTLRLSPKALKTIDRDGIDAVVARITKQGGSL